MDKESSMLVSAKKRAPRRPSEFPSFKFALANPLFNDRVLVIRRSEENPPQAPPAPPPPMSPGLTSANRKRKATEEKESSHRKKRKNRWSRSEVKALRDRFRQFLHTEDEPEQSEYHTLPVCSVLLSAYSTVFRTMLSSGLLESDSQTIIIEVDSLLEARAVTHMIEFFYGSSLDPNMTIRDKLELFLMCNRYDVPILLTRCTDDLKACMDSDLAAFLVSMRERFDLSPLCTPLLDAGVDMLLQQYYNFEKEWQTDKFLKLDYACVRALLDSPKLNVRNENTVFQAVYRWLTKSDECCEDHKGHYFVGSHLVKAQALMSCIRLTELSFAFDVDVVFDHPLFKSLPNSKEIEKALSLSFGYTSSNSARRDRYKDLLEPAEHPRRMTVISTPLLEKPKRNNSGKKKESKESKDSKESKEEKKHESKDEKELFILRSDSATEMWFDGYCFHGHKLFHDEKTQLFLAIDAGKTGLANEFFVNTCITLNDSQKHTHLFKQGDVSLQLEFEDSSRETHTIDISVDRSL